MDPPILCTCTESAYVREGQTTKIKSELYYEYTLEGCTDPDDCT